MIYILISVVASVGVSVLLKLARLWQLDLNQIIGFNYVSAIALSWLLLPTKVALFDQIINPHLPWVLLIALGLILPSLFIIMGKAVQHAGIVRSDAAQRLSLFLPILAAFIIFAESISTHKIVSLCIAFFALFCLLYQQRSANNKPERFSAFLLFIVWVGYGLVDILFKQFAKNSLDFSSGLMISFSLALIFIFVYLLIKRSHWRLTEALYGLLLGAFNFCNIYFYITAHQHYQATPTLVFTSMNIGVIALGTIIGTLCFNEKMNRLNILGIVLAILAIAMQFNLF